MSLAELSGAISSQLGALWGPDTQAACQAILEDAEVEVNLQIGAMPVDPLTTTPGAIQTALSAKRAEMYAEATIAFLSGMTPAISLAVAEAVYGFLQAHAEASYLPGTLQAGTYPVTQIGPAATKITY